MTSLDVRLRLSAMQGPTFRACAQPLILASAASGVERAIAAAGTAPHRVFELAGVAPERIADPSLRLDLIDYCRLIDTAAGQTGDSLFGARFGHHFTPNHFGAVGTLVVSTPTLGDGLAALARHYGWIQENTRLAFRRDGRVATLEYQIHDGRIRAREQDAELTLAALCGLIRHCLGPGWRPLEAQFEHAPGGARRDYRAIFGDGLCFDQPTNAILLDARALTTPMPRPDPRAFAAARAYIGRVPVADADDGGLLATLRSVVESQCKRGDVGIAAVARRMGVRVHFLRRRLQASGVAFDDLLSHARRDLAQYYVETSDRPLTEIALLLGYSELSAFSRAFRKWTGTSATALRRAARTGDRGAR